MNTMTEHTGGMWYWDDSGLKDWHAEAELMSDIDGETIGFCSFNNAPLIVSAPKLLKALKAIKKYDMDGWILLNDKVQGIINEAIAEAKVKWKV